VSEECQIKSLAPEESDQTFYEKHLKNLNYEWRRVNLAIPLN
jgi:hypothetical protein